MEGSVSFRETASVPENWPKVPKLRELHWISDLTNCKTPSVKRAVSHIKLVQDVVDDWLLKVTNHVLSGQKSSDLEVGTLCKFQKVPDINTGSAACHDGHLVKITPPAKLMSSGSASGCRVSPLWVSEARQTHETNLVGIPYLGAQEVIEEVYLLLAELENDRMETQDKYLNEVKRAEWLRQQIDELQLRHLQELPAVVQKEHEACIMDLNELNWHVTYTKRLLTKAQGRFSVCDQQNRKMREGIEFMKQHIPQVQEKLVLEVQAMDSIRKAQGEANHKLVVAQQKETKTEMRSQETWTMAETERGHRKRELDKVKDDLTDICNELNEVKATFAAYVHQVNDLHTKLAANGRELEVMKVKASEAEVKEAKQARKVTNLQTKVTEAEFDQQYLQNEGKQQQQNLAKSREDHAHVLTETQLKVRSVELVLQSLTRQNLERVTEVQSYEDKINNCQQQKTSDAKNVTRINKDIENTGDLLQQTSDKLQEVSNINHRLQDQLQFERDRAFNVEQRLKKATESVRRQVQEEVRTKATLQAQMNSDLLDIDKTQTDLSANQEKARKVTSEIEQAVADVAEKVGRLQASRNQSQQLKEELSYKIRATDQQYAERSQMFTESLTQLEPQHQMAKLDLKGLKEDIQTMKQKSESMKSQMEEMDAAQVMMDRFNQRTQNEISVLSEEMKELSMQVEAARKIEDELRQQNHKTMERLRQNESQHKKLQKERQQILLQQESEKMAAVDRNKALASRYRQLQNKYILRKEQVLKVYDDRVKIEAAIADIKQLKSLQVRLHGALVAFFRVSGLFTKTEVSRLEHQSLANGLRLSELQANMEQALAGIAQFLSSQKERATVQTSGRTGVNHTSSLKVVAEGGITVGSKVDLSVEVGV